MLTWNRSPVGLCALINAENFKPKNLIAVDSVESRLDLAKSLGGEPWNFQTDREGLDKRVKELTDGRGADVVIGETVIPQNFEQKLSDNIARGGWFERSLANGL